MLELDLVLLPFFENIYSDLPADQQYLFQQLLECEDQDLFNWFLKKSDPSEPELLQIVTIVRNNTGLQVS